MADVFSHVSEDDESLCDDNMTHTSILNKSVRTVNVDPHLIKLRYD